MLSLGIVDYDPLALYALRDLVLRSSERIRLLWSVRSRRAALRRLAAVEPVPDVILIDSELSDDSGRTAPLAREASEAGAAVVAMSASGVEGEGAVVRSDADGSHGSRAVVPKETLLLGEGRSGGYCGAWRRRRSMTTRSPFRQWQGPSAIRSVGSSSCMRWD